MLADVLSAIESYIPDFSLQEVSQGLIILDFAEKRLKGGSGKAKFQPGRGEWETARSTIAEMPDDDRRLK